MFALIVKEKQTEQGNEENTERSIKKNITKGIKSVIGRQKINKSMKITKEKNELVIRIPLKQKESNCYKDDKDLDDVDNLVGIIAGDEFSISHLNDLSYKDTQQEGSPIIMFDDEDELREACKVGKIMIWTHEICAYCGGVIRGSFSVGKKGSMCWDCEYEKES